MIKLTAILREIAENSGLIGPFYHETSEESVGSILKTGLKPHSLGHLSYPSVSLSPSQSSHGMYGGVTLQVWLTEDQFKKAMKNTLFSLGEQGDPEQKNLMQRYVSGLITPDEEEILIDMALNDPDFAAGEIILFNTRIPANQIKISK